MVSPFTPAISRASGRADCRSPMTPFACTATTGWRRRKPAFATADRPATGSICRAASLAAAGTISRPIFSTPVGLPVTENIGDGRVWTIDRQRRRPNHPGAAAGGRRGLERRRSHTAGRRLPHAGRGGRYRVDAHSQHRSRGYSRGDRLEPRARREAALWRPMPMPATSAAPASASVPHLGEEQGDYLEFRADPAAVGSSGGHCPLRSPT